MSAREQRQLAAPVALASRATTTKLGSSKTTGRGFSSRSHQLQRPMHSTPSGFSERHVTALAPSIALRQSAALRRWASRRSTRGWARRASRHRTAHHYVAVPTMSSIDPEVRVRSPRWRRLLAPSCAVLKQGANLRQSFVPFRHAAADCRKIGAPGPAHGKRRGREQEKIQDIRKHALCLTPPPHAESLRPGTGPEPEGGTPTCSGQIRTPTRLTGITGVASCIFQVFKFPAQITRILPAPGPGVEPADKRVRGVRRVPGDRRARTSTVVAAGRPVEPSGAPCTASSPADATECP